MTNRSHPVDIVMVAKAAGVSISTVSRSFNHPKLLKPETRKRIDQAVRDLGYIRNRAAQTMHGIRSGTIGMVVPTIDHTIFGELIQSFTDAVSEQGFTILLATHGYNLEREYSALRKFMEHRVDGVALIGMDHSEETFNLIESQSVPAVSLWNYDAASRVSCVGADNFQAGKLAAEHILGLGHRKIATIFSPSYENDRARARKDGVVTTLESRGVVIADAWNIVATYNTTQAKAAAYDLLGNEHGPTALICGNDVLATSALYAATARGISVPDNLSIIGIGDFKGSCDLEPALTTVRIPAKEIGRLAADEIAKAITSSDPRTITREKCDLTLLNRRTTAPHA